MQVYRVFFRILYKHKGQVFMYLCIFLGLATLISNINAEDGDSVFEASEYYFTVFDEDDSQISRNLIAYLEQDHQRVEIPDGRESIQDELYNRNTNCVIRIPKGFGESVETGAIEKMEITTIPGSVYQGTFENLVSNYLVLLRSYMAAGFSRQDAVEKTEEVCQMEAEVELSDVDAGNYSKMYYFFLYAPYIFISICVVGVGPILIVFHRRDVRDRQNCAAYSGLRMQGELFAGMVTAGAVFCVLYYTLTFLGAGPVTGTRGLFYCLNMVCFAVVALGLTFLMCQFVRASSVLSMIANIVGLGFSFLSGIFVPLDLLGEGVIRVAHFLPSYWYVVAAEEIDHYRTGDSLSVVWQCMGLELLFALAFLCVGIVCARARVQNSR